LTNDEKNRTDQRFGPIPNEGARTTSRVVLQNPAYAKWRLDRGSPINLTVKTNTLSIASNEVRAYAQLQQEIHDALRVQHPDWVKPNGDCPTCESYESRLAELLGLSPSTEHRSAA
jgi:hypothetical protein